MATCSKCGAELIGSRKFCAACGAPVVAGAASPAAASIAPAALPDGTPAAPMPSPYQPPPVADPFASTAMAPGSAGNSGSDYGPPPPPMQPAQPMQPMQQPQAQPAQSPLATSNLVPGAAPAAAALRAFHAPAGPYGAPPPAPQPGYAPPPPPQPAYGMPPPPAQQPYAPQSPYGAPPQPFAPGSRVNVQWADGNRYVATVQQFRDGYCLVAFPNGHQQWVDVRYLSPAC